MRLKADIWVKAYVRRCAGEGVAAAVVRHGDDHAGAIFIRVNKLDGTSLLFGPAPAGMDGASSDRTWVSHGAVGKPAMPDQDVDARLAREFEFDPDIWIVEIEDREGRHFLDDWLAAGPRSWPEIT